MFVSRPCERPATVAQALLILNRGSGLRWKEGVAQRIRQTIEATLGPPTEVSWVGVDSHPEARERSREFMRAQTAPACLFVGGGGGTLRAVVEGAIEAGDDVLPAASRIVFAPLRMGSGNVVAKQLAVPLDPIEGARELCESLRAGRTTPVAVIGAEWGTPGGGRLRGYATTMCGLGQFGRAPGDLERWHRRLPRLRRCLAAILGLERLNDAEYASAMLARSVASALSPGICESVELVTGDEKQRFRLLAGVVLSFAFPALPFKPNVAIHDEALSLHVVPYPGRLGSLTMVLAPRLARRSLRRRLAAGGQATLCLPGENEVEFFLDEDPERASGWLRVFPAGTLAFVPGASFRART